MTILSCLAALPSPTRADTLLFNNGDRLSGTALSANAGEIHFQADTLGAIVVEADQAVVVPGETRTPTQSASTNDRSSEMEPLQVRPAEGKLSPKVPRSRLARPSDWSRQLEFGVTDQSGRRDLRDVALRIDLTRANADGEVRLQGRYLYGQSENERATDKLAGALRLRRGLTPDLFAQMETRYERDSISEIDHDAEQTIGVGTSIVRRDGLTLSVGGGAAARFRESAATNDGWSYLVDAFQEFKFAVNRQVTLSQNLSVVMSPFQEEVLAVKLNAALSSAITDAIKLVMRYEFEYDHSLVPDARENQRLVTSFGYLF